MKLNLPRIKLLGVLCVLATIVMACAIDTTYSGTLNVIEGKDVQITDPHTIVIDARGQEAYDKGHLKGAICIAPSELVTDNPVAASLAPKEQVEKVLSTSGISNDSKVYIYDDNDGVSASRVWWTLRVYGHQNVMIINGGASALVNEGLELTQESTVLPETQYVAKSLDTSKIATYEQVESQVDNPQENVAIIDVRSIAEYEAGYIPGAILYPHTKNLYKDGTFMSSRDIGLFYSDLGLEKDDAIILYCKSSFRATQTAALLEEAGYQSVKVYDGAWIEWSSKNEIQVPVEEKAPLSEQEGS